MDTMPAGGGPVGALGPMFDENEFGPTQVRVRVPVPLSYLTMVAALADGELTREDLATPADVRYFVEFEVAHRGMRAVLDAAERLQTANLNGDDWLLFCHRAVAEMLAAEGIRSGMETLSADELVAALTVFGELYAENLSAPSAVRAELTRIAYTVGVTELRANAAALAVEPYQVVAPSFDVEGHGWPAFCHQAVAGMLAADATAVRSAA